MVRGRLPRVPRRPRRRRRRAVAQRAGLRRPGDGRRRSPPLNEHGPAVLGAGAALAIALGLRSGSDGGPIAIEPPDVRHLLLAPVPRREVLTRPVVQRLRSMAFGGALVGAIAGQLAARRLPGSGEAWAASAARRRGGDGRAVRRRRRDRPRRCACPAGWPPGSPSLVLVAQGLAIAGAIPGPGDSIGSFALWGMRAAARRPRRHRRRRRARPVVAVAARRAPPRRAARAPRRPRVAAALRRDDAGPAHRGPAAPPAARRAAARPPVVRGSARRSTRHAGARRLAARLARPRCATRSPASRGWPRCRRRRRRRRSPCCAARRRRSSASASPCTCSASTPSSRCRRRSTTPTTPTASRSTRGWMLAHHVAAPALALVPVRPARRGPVGRARARRSWAARWRSACRSRWVGVSRRGRQHRARRARPAGAADGLVGRRAAGVRRVHVDDPAALPARRQRRSPALPVAGGRASSPALGTVVRMVVRAAHRGRGDRVVDPQARRVAGARSGSSWTPGAPAGRTTMTAALETVGADQDVRRRAGARSRSTSQVAAGRARRAARAQRQRQDDAAADGRRAARADRRLGDASLGHARSARSRPAPRRRTSATSRCSTTTSASGSTSSTSPSCTATTTGRRTPPTSSRPSACSTARDDLPTTFSRGLRQKAAIALAFVRPFELLLVDEPFVGLDRTGRDALLELFDRVHADGAALVVATHELTTVGAAQRLVALRDGALVLRRRRRRAPTSTPSSPADGGLDPATTVPRVGVTVLGHVRVRLRQRLDLRGGLARREAHREVRRRLGGRRHRARGQRHHRLPEAATHRRRRGDADVDRRRRSRRRRPTPAADAAAGRRRAGRLGHGAGARAGAPAPRRGAPTAGDPARPARGARDRRPPPARRRVGLRRRRRPPRAAPPTARPSRPRRRSRPAGTPTRPAATSCATGTARRGPSTCRAPASSTPTRPSPDPRDGPRR